MTPNATPQSMPVTPTGPLAPPQTLRRSSGKRLAVYLLIFVSGCIVGVGLTLLGVRQRALSAVRNPELIPERIVRRLTWELSLSNDQQKKIEAMVRDRQKKLQSLRRELQPQIAGELDRLERDVSSVLDPKQDAKWRRRVDRWRALLAAPPAAQP